MVRVRLLLYRKVVALSSLRAYTEGCQYVSYPTCIVLHRQTSLIFNRVDVLGQETGHASSLLLLGRLTLTI